MTTPVSPILPPCHYCGPDCPVPFGLCHCGCGGQVKPCTQDSPKDNWIKGRPMKYIRHHHKRRNWSERFRSLPERPEGVPFGYCWCGCGGKAPLAAQSWPRLGVRKGEPMRHIKNHFPYTTGPDYLEEFATKVSDITTPCWIWQHAQQKHGYGARHSKDGSSRLAHRMMYERHRGPIAKNLDLDHLCRVPSCVNPDHLEPVPHRVNSERGCNSKLDHDKADDIRRRRNSGEHWKNIAVEYGVGYSCIRSVCNFDTWIRQPDIVTQKG